MRSVIQRVSKASVKIGNKVHSAIDKGLLIFLGIEDTDGQEDIEWLAGKICRLRIFNDPEEVMNLSVMDVKGEILVVSQFTLHGSTKKGNRPSYIKASKPETAIPLYNAFVDELKKESKLKIQTGDFGAHMEIDLINDGPVTIMIDTKKKE